MGAKDKTVAYLHAHGLSVEPDALNDLFRKAVSSLPGVLHRTDPREDLPPHEVELLQRGGLDLDADVSPDPLAKTVATFAALIRDSYTAGEAAEMLGVNRSRIRQRILDRSLYGFKIDNEWRIPAFQFDESGNALPGLSVLVRELDPSLHPVAVLRWFTSPDPELVAEELSEEPLSPQQWLMAGRSPEVVVQIAADL